MDKRKLIIITGPTAVGKTALSVCLAKKIGGEIISADSMQVYRGLDIGTDKVKEKEMDGVRHHLIDVCDVCENYDVARFKEMANDAMEGIYKRGHIPIITGGTGFYIQAVLYDIDFKSEEDEEFIKLRSELEELSTTEQGYQKIREELKKVDPESFEKIHENNRKRNVRALHYYKIHKKPISLHNKEEREKSPAFDALYFVLNDDRELLYDRINKRVDEMMKEGLIEEARKLYDMHLSPDSTALAGIGYKEIFKAFNGEITIEEASELIKKHSRNYAKRQLTWFRREKNVTVINIDKFKRKKEEIAKWIEEQCMKRWE